MKQEERERERERVAKGKEGAFSHSIQFYSRESFRGKRKDRMKLSLPPKLKVCFLSFTPQVEC
jgi:hypothetical protein